MATVPATKPLDRLEPRPVIRQLVKSGLIRLRSPFTDRCDGSILTTYLSTRLVPILCAAPKVGFNIFDVLHHGTHEKQLSNLFAWMLDARGSHSLGARFVADDFETYDGVVP